MLKSHLLSARFRQIYKLSRKLRDAVCLNWPATMKTWDLFMLLIFLPFLLDWEGDRAVCVCFFSWSVLLCCLQARWHPSNDFLFIECFVLPKCFDAVPSKWRVAAEGEEKAKVHQPPCTRTGCPLPSGARWLPECGDAVACTARSNHGDRTAVSLRPHRLLDRNRNANREQLEAPEQWHRLA